MNVMPARDRELADGAAAVAILDDLHEIAPLAGREAVGSPIVEDQPGGAVGGTNLGATVN